MDRSKKNETQVQYQDQDTVYYNRRADLDVFDQWTYKVDTWRNWNKVNDRMTVKILVNFMSGKASRFFMKHVSLQQRINEALFNHCFPLDFNSLQLTRERMMCTLSLQH
jgi:hypothetical protein